VLRKLHHAPEKNRLDPGKNPHELLRVENHQLSRH
jgi:hypothetical protein